MGRSGVNFICPFVALTADGFAPLLLRRGVKLVLAM